MPVVDVTKLNRAMKVYVSSMVFLFSAISLITPSGYSYGPVLLLLGSFVLLLNLKSLHLTRHDWIFILVIGAYVGINFILIIFHNLPISSFDKLVRYLFAIPVYLLLIAYKPYENYLWNGLIVGALGAAVMAVAQQFGFFNQAAWPNRSSGFLNPIQFGDVSLLIGLLLFPFFLQGHSKDPKAKLFIFFPCLMGFFASFLSLSRGGWVAVPFVLAVTHKNLSYRVKKLLFICFALSSLVFITAMFFLPKSNSFKDRVIYTETEIIKIFSSDRSEQKTYTSISSRMKMWENGFMAFTSQPIFGWGDLKAIKLNFPSQWQELNQIDDFNHLHNEYIDALAKKGIIGFFALMMLYLQPLYYFMVLMRSRQLDILPYATAGTVLIISVMVFGLTQCFLAHNSGTTIFIFYLVIIKAYCRNVVESRPQQTKNSNVKQL